MSGETSKLSIDAARVAMREGRWVDALENWNRLIDGSSTIPVVWEIGRARALQKLARLPEAETAFRLIVQKDPNNPTALAGLSKVLIGRSKFDERLLPEALLLAEHPVFNESEQTIIKKLDLLISAQKIEKAKSLILKAMGSFNDWRSIRRAFTVTGMVFEPGERPTAYQRLLNRLRSIDLPANDKVPIGILELGLLLSLRRDTSYLHRLEQLNEAIGSAQPPTAHILRSIGDRLRATRSTVFQEPKVFGIGLSKTGTTTLANALTDLGIDTAHWTNPITRQLLASSDFYMLGAATDTPVSASFETLAETYPNAKFILTSRPLPSWLESMTKHYALITGVGGLETMKRNINETHNWRYGLESAAIHQALYLKHASFEAAYDHHRNRVLRYFESQPKAKFLELNVFDGHGWPELCTFLGKPIPDKPFPWSNRAKPIEDAE